MNAALIVVLIATSAATAQAQSFLSGKVLTTDSASIVAAHVSVYDANRKLKGEALTDSAGGFRFRIANISQPVTLYVSVVRVGFVSIAFAPVRLGSREDLSVRVHMSPHAVELSPLTVIARQRSWSATLDDYSDKLDHAKRGFGHALERHVMERYAGMDLLSALQRVPGVQYGDSVSPGGLRVTVAKMRGGCLPLAFLDRAPIAADELAAIDPATLQGVLVWIGDVDLPPDFSRLDPRAACGLILAYTAPPPKGRRNVSFRKVALAVAAFTAIVLIQR